MSAESGTNTKILSPYPRLHLLDDRTDISFKHEYGLFLIYQFFAFSAILYRAGHMDDDVVQNTRRTRYHDGSLFFAVSGPNTEINRTWNTRSPATILQRFERTRHRVPNGVSYDHVSCEILQALK